MDVFDLIGGELSDVSFEEEEEEEEQQSKHNVADVDSTACRRRQSGDQKQTAEEAFAKVQQPDNTAVGETICAVENGATGSVSHLATIEASEGWGAGTCDCDAAGCSVDEWAGVNAVIADFLAQRHHPTRVQSLSPPHLLERLRRKYLELGPVSKLSGWWKLLPGWGTEETATAITTVLFDRCGPKVFGQLAPPREYRTSVMNRLVSDLENSGCGTCPASLCEHLAETLLAAQRRSAASRDSPIARPAIDETLAYRRLFFHKTEVVLRCSRAIGVGYGTGSEVWPAGKTFSHLVARFPRMLRGRSVLELGSGTGVLGICAALSCAQFTDTTKDGAAVDSDENGNMLLRLCLTDYLEPVLKNIRHNVVVNGLELATPESPVGPQVVADASSDDVARFTSETITRSPLRVEVQKLDWAHPDEFRHRLDAFDTIIASDLIADPKAAVLLCNVLRQFLTVKGMHQRGHCCSSQSRCPQVLIMLQRRQEETYETFLHSAVQSGLTINTLQTYANGVHFVNITLRRHGSGALPDQLHNTGT